MFRRRDRGEPEAMSTLEGVAAELADVLGAVQAAVEACAATREADPVPAWRDLHTTVLASADRLDRLRGQAATPRLERMVLLTTDEVWRTAEPWLSAVVPATPEDMGLLWSALWSRAEAARADHATAGRDRVAPARERLLRMVAQADAGLDHVAGEQLDAWRQSTDELRRFVHQAFGGRGQR